jgi:hypothetical protein
MKFLVDEMHYQNTLFVKTVNWCEGNQCNPVILDKINNIFAEITKISEFNKKVYFSYFKKNVNLHVSSLDELGDLLERLLQLLQYSPVLEVESSTKFLVEVKINQSAYM